MHGRVGTEPLIASRSGAEVPSPTFASSTAARMRWALALNAATASSREVAVSGVKPITRKTYILS